MFRIAALCSAVLLAASPASAADDKAVLVLAEDGGLDSSAVRALRSLAAAQLRKRGVALVDDRWSEEVRPPDASTSAHLREIGVGRLFVLRVGGRLGVKVPLSLDETHADRLTPIASANLVAATLEESDVVVPRLVDAVVDRRNIDDNARLGTVTASESRAFKKKPGERFITLGIPIGLYRGTGDGAPAGFSIGYFYEAEHFRLGGLFDIASKDASEIGFMGIHSAWLPFDSMFTPYFGGGVGYMGSSGEGGVGVMAEVGVEMFRLYGVRLLAGVDFMFPLYRNAGKTVFPLAHVRLGF